MEIEKFYHKEEIQKNDHRNYFKNQHVKGVEETAKLFSVADNELPFFTPTDRPVFGVFPPDGSPFEAMCGNTGMLLRDMSRALYLSLPMNAEIMNYGDGLYPMKISVADKVAYHNLFQPDYSDNPLAGYHTIIGGMEQLIHRLLKDLDENPRVTLKASFWVTSIVEEDDKSFTVSSESITSGRVKGSKLILACNRLGIQQISWTSSYNRATPLHRLISRVQPCQAVKLFLTYDKAWWEEKGLFCGSLQTDLAVKEITAFGSRGKSSEFATLLAAFTYVHTDIFAGLNMPHYPKFINKVGNVPPNLIPSQLMVDYVHKQLQKVFG